MTAELRSVFGELTEARRWVCRGEAGGKVPLDPATGRRASSTDPTTWGTFEEAVRAHEARGLAGIGFVLGDGLGGVDLDACRDPETGVIAPWARKIIDGFGSYAEVSPSGTGVKLLAYGAPAELPASTIPIDAPAPNGKRPAIEVYVTGRYFALTGEIIDGVPDEIVDAGEPGGAWDRMVRLLRERGAGRSGERQAGQATGATEMSLGLCGALDEDPRLRQLWTEGHEGGTDRSRNDAALATTLAAKGFGDADIEAALRCYPLGQIGQGALMGQEADRQVSRLLGLAAEARERRNGDEAGPPKPPSLPRLPASFWDERPVLTQVRQAAHARNRSPDAVLFAVLARVAAFRPPQMQIDTGIASAASLNLLVAFVDPSGGGKSSPEKIARRLVPAPHDMEDADGLPLGSGEGLAEAYMGWTTQPREDDPSKKEKVRAQVRWNCLFYADEGSVLSRLSERTGSTLGESLRRAFNGETLGQTNATQDRTRRVRDYSLGLIAGLQPAAALALLEEADFGTPQRFLWSSVIDPTIPDETPPWPGEIRPSLLEHFRPLTIDQDICRDLRRDDTARQRGELVRHPLDAHEPLVRLKVAGALAVLDDRTHIDRDDWRLADTVWETSCGVRNTVADYGRALMKAREREQTKQYVTRSVAADRAVQREQATVERIARVIARHVQRSAEPATDRDLHHAVASRDRRHKDRAVAHAIRAGWIVEDQDGRYGAGRYGEETAR